MSAKSDFGAIYVDVDGRGSFLAHAATTLKRVFAIERTPLTLTIPERKEKKGSQQRVENEEEPHNKKECKHDKRRCV